jgi:hypothetical protein
LLHQKSDLEREGRVVLVVTDWAVEHEEDTVMVIDGSLEALFLWQSWEPRYMFERDQMRVGRKETMDSNTYLG